MSSLRAQARRNRRAEQLVPSRVVSRQGTELRAAATAREAARARSRNPVTRFYGLVREVINKADRDRMLGLAAETAFFAVLTLFPALLVVTAVLGQLSHVIGETNARKVESGVINFLDTLLTSQASGAIDTVRNLFDSNSNALTIASLLALASLSTAFSTLINTVNITCDVPETRGWWRRRWLGLLLGVGTVLTGAIAVTLLIVGPLFAAGQILNSVGLDQEYNFLWYYVRWPVAFLALMLWATTMDHLAPARRTRWRHDLPGGFLTALLWLAVSYGLNVYLRYFVASSPVFGALGGGLILMTWFYLLCVALLSGAELNTILLARRRHRPGQQASDVAAVAVGPLHEDSEQHIARPSSVLHHPNGSAAEQPHPAVGDDRDQQPAGEPEHERRAAGATQRR